MSSSTQAHWDHVYGTKAISEVSWYELRPERSLELIRRSGVRRSDPIIDVGGGASFVVDALLDAGYSDVTVLDISAKVLEKLCERLGPRYSCVAALQQDVVAFRPARRYALWHDRAVFHFLTEREEREHYLEALRQGLQPNGQVIIATFGPCGPERCSGLATMHYDARGLEAEMGSDFCLLESALALHRTPRGIEQQFLYCRFGRRTGHLPRHGQSALGR